MASDLGMELAKRSIVSVTAAFNVLNVPEKVGDLTLMQGGRMMLLMHCIDQLGLDDAIRDFFADFEMEYLELDRKNEVERLSHKVPLEFKGKRHPQNS